MKQHIINSEFFMQWCILMLNDVFIFFHIGPKMLTSTDKNSQCWRMDILYVIELEPKIKNKNLLHLRGFFLHREAGKGTKTRHNKRRGEARRRNEKSINWKWSWECLSSFLPSPPLPCHFPPFFVPPRVMRKTGNLFFFGPLPWKQMP